MKRISINFPVIVALIAACMTSASCSSDKDAATVEMTPIMKKALHDSSSIFYADFASYPQTKDTLPIGVFDSGTGGLTVLEVLLKSDNVNNITGTLGSDGIPDFAGEDFQYLADQANMPYGTYPSEGKEDYLRELAVKDALFLLGDRYYLNNSDNIPEGRKNKVKILVIACNTATAYGLKDINNLLKLSDTGVKVIGVINAGVNATFEDLRSSKQRDSVAVGVLATVGTISSNAYPRTIAEVKASTGYKGYVQVVSQPGAGFAEAVDLEKDFVDLSLSDPRSTYRGPVLGTAPDDIKEELLDVYNFDYSGNALLWKKEDGKYTQFQLNSAANYARFHLVSLVEQLRNSKEKSVLKSVILGCTHYPFLLDTLNQVITELKNYRKNGKLIYAPLIADDFKFIDPAVFTALECYNTLRSDKQLALRARDGKVLPFISVPCYSIDDKNLEENGGLTHDFKYGREVGTEDITTVCVPFSKENLNPDNLRRLEKLVPYSYKKISENLR